MRPFFLHKHPCPECYGNVAWLATNCPHCQYRITASDRFDWLPKGVHLSVFVVLSLFLTLSGQSLLNWIGVF